MMILIVLVSSAIASTLLWFKYFRNNRYLFKYFVAFLWGAVIMIFVDNLYSYYAGEIIIEFTSREIMLSFILLSTAILMWLVVFLVNNRIKWIVRNRK